MKNPLVSIIIPVYNAERYLSICIDSVLCQSYQNFELILINDGSTDNSSQICGDYSQKDNRVKIISQSNLGVSAARNKGIIEAIGEYITFIDSDDWIENNYLKSFISVLEKSPDFVVSGYTRDYLTKKIVQEYFPEPSYSKSFQEIQQLVPKLNDKRLFVTIWAKFYKRKIVKINDIMFDSQISYGEDVAYCWNYLCHINSIVVLKNAGYHYRQEIAESFSNRKYNFDQWYKSALKINLYHNLFSHKYQLVNNTHFMQRLNDYFLAMFLSACYSMYRKGHLQPKAFRLEKLKLYSKHKYFRIKPEESLFTKLIKKMLLLNLFELVDFAMVVRSKFLRA